MQDEITVALQVAWQRMFPLLRHDPQELARRIARQTSALITRPPRPWCLALRATDTRLAKYSLHHASIINHHSHDIRLTSSDLKKLCAPVHLTAPGETLTDVAAKLGTTPQNLLDARLAGVFRTHHIPSRCGHPTPLLYTDQPLDPAARSFAIADPIWSFTTAAALNRIPPAHPRHPDARFPRSAAAQSLARFSRCRRSSSRASAQRSAAPKKITQASAARA